MVTEDTRHRREATIGLILGSLVGPILVAIAATMPDLVMLVTGPVMWASILASLVIGIVGTVVDAMREPQGSAFGTLLAGLGVGMFFSVTFMKFATGPLPI